MDAYHELMQYNEADYNFFASLGIGDIEVAQNRVLFVAKEDSHIRNFHLPYMKWFQEQGWEVHVACNGEPGISCCDREYLVPFERNPLSWSNRRAIRMMRKLLRDNQYDIVHCHTPSAAAVTRWAARKLSAASSMKIIYTAHGFYFHRGGPWYSWLLYYPVEKYLSRYTDLLITMNEEDYLLAGNKFSHGVTVYIPGVGVDLRQYSATAVDRQAKRREFGISDNDFVIISVGELDQRKNHQQVIKALALMEERSDIYYLICGRGEREDSLKKLASDAKVNLILAGYRSDVPEVLAAADLFIFPSLREGLPRALMEAMAAGVPVIASDIRGNNDLIEHGVEGMLFPLGNTAALREQISYMRRNPAKAEQMVAAARIKLQRFSLAEVMEQMIALYRSAMEPERKISTSEQNL